MIAWANTLGQLRDRVDFLIERLGPDAFVGTDCDGYLDCMGVQLEIVYIDKSYGKIVGDEASDYKPKENEAPGVLVS